MIFNSLDPAEHTTHGNLHRGYNLSMVVPINCVCKAVPCLVLRYTTLHPHPSPWTRLHMCACVKGLWRRSPHDHSPWPAQCERNPGAIQRRATMWVVSMFLALAKCLNSALNVHKCARRALSCALPVCELCFTTASRFTRAGMH